MWYLYLFDNIKLGSKEFKRASNGKTVYLYLIENLVNGKIYVGVRSYSHKDVSKDKYLGNGMSLKRNGDIEFSSQSKQTHLARSYIKYGIENFKKHILFYYDNLVDALIDERIVVNEDFIKSKFSMNMIVGGGLPPTGSGSENNNYNNFWNQEQKDSLSVKLKESEHNKRGNNVKASKCIVYDLINDLSYNLDCMSDIDKIDDSVKDFTPLTYISKFRYYFVPIEYKGIEVNELIEKFAIPQTKRTYKMINLYKEGVVDRFKLVELTGLRHIHVSIFLKLINKINENKNN